jgi:hypothetical protein
LPRTAGIAGATPTIVPFNLAFAAAAAGTGPAGESIGPVAGGAAGIGADGGGTSAGGGMLAAPGLPTTAGIAGATPTIVPFSFDLDGLPANPGAAGAAGGGASGGEPGGRSPSVIVSPLLAQC